VDFDTEVIRSAKQRLDKELGLYRVVRRQVFGDDAFEDELAEEGRLDVAMRYEPPPEEPRQTKRRLWAWNILQRGRMGK
jgi:DNA-binding transcriptional LysR family regulator